MALFSLIRTWQQPFQRYASIVTKDPDLAADVVQEAWIKIIKALPRLKDPVSFQAWAYRIVNNQCMDVLRKRSTQYRETNVLDEKINPIGDLEQQEQIQSLLAQLSNIHRTVLALHYLVGLEIEEIAKITNVPKGTVKSRLFNARDKFRILLTGNKEGETHEPARQTNRSANSGSFANSI